MRRTVVRAASLLVILGAASSAAAHGSRVTWELDGGSVLITAAFDDGTPMDSAQVTVFSGAEPEVPWLVSRTDDLGTFRFMPDRELSLRWDVQVRKAGHGDIVSISLDPDAAASAGTGFSPLQIALMAACVVWGFTGTAFFFASRRKRC